MLAVIMTRITHTSTTSLTAGCVERFRRSALSGGLEHIKVPQVVSQCLFKAMYLFIAPCLLLIGKQLWLTAFSLDLNILK